MNAVAFVPLVEVIRGGEDLLENRHWGALSVVCGRGEELHALGDTARAFALRSTAKPFQLLPFLLEGLDVAGADRPAASAADLAVMMSSHSGEPMHTERVADVLARFGLSAQALRCGVHPPIHEASRDSLAGRGKTPSALHCNCSGKHANMLAVCTSRGWPTETYLEPDHPVQLRIQALLGALSESGEAPLRHSIDGCSAPTFWVPLKGFARMFASLACPGEAQSVEGRSAEPQLERLFDAATAHPEMVGGSGRLDTRLMRAMNATVMAKGGAAGLYAAAVRPSERHPNGLGIAVKVADSDPDSRVRSVVITTVLEQLGISPSLAEVEDRKLMNIRQIQVGEYRPVFEL